MHMQSDHIHSYCRFSDYQHKELHDIYVITISKIIIIFSVINILCRIIFSHSHLCQKVLNFLRIWCCQLCDSFQCLQNIVIIGQWGPTMMSHHTRRLLYHGSNEDKSCWWHSSYKEKQNIIMSLMIANLITALLVTPEDIKKETPSPESLSKLHWPSDRRLMAKSVPTFEGRGVSRS
jgi:hypothetical protein